MGMTNITREQFHAFVNKEEHHPGAITSGTLHYLTYFDKYSTTGKKINWNWSAFFSLSMWWLYRKMYAYGFLVIFVLILSDLLWAYLLGPWGVLVSWLFPSILGGLYGDYLYLRHASKKIAKGINASGVTIWPVGLMGLLMVGAAVGEQAVKLSDAHIAKGLTQAAEGIAADDPISA
jgi:Protein of unknown function (DUF2628)